MGCRVYCSGLLFRVYKVHGIGLKVCLSLVEGIEDTKEAVLGGPRNSFCHLKPYNPKP